jgi:hypothetical protein
MALADDSKVLTRIEDWRRRLIDLSYRNRLIRYQPSGSSLEIASPAIEVLFADLGRTAPWRFYLPPEPEPMSAAMSAGPEGPASDTTAAPLGWRVVDRPELRDRAPRADEIVLVEKSARRITRTVETLARRSNAEYQDKALRILYIAAGLLEWVDPGRGEQLLSPLVLVPVELQRDSPREPYVLRFVDDEEVVVNPSLTEKLRRDLGREIPIEWTWDDKPISVELDEIDAAVAGTGWTVRRSAVLGLFSFQKFVMYRDLLDNESVISAHPAVRSLALNQLAEEVGGWGIAVPEPSKLDEEQPPQRDVLILDSRAREERSKRRGAGSPSSCMGLRAPARVKRSRTSSPTQSCRGNGSCSSVRRRRHSTSCIVG